jgi:3-methylfumaryl-CoA hydratase
VDTATLDIEILKSWIGRSKTQIDVIRPQPITMMAATLGQSLPQLEDAAPLPPAWHWLYFLEAKPRGDLGRDGHAALGEFLPPVALPRRMWAGGRFDFFKPVRIGETIKKVSTINKIERKSGRSGELCFVTVRHELFAEEELRLSEDHEIVYREDANGDDAPPTPPPAPDDAEVQETITPDPVLLFRYSALTFNSHRIHYDVDYCRDVEGYPGLVFHGPLTATLLVDLAERQSGQSTVSNFSYRAASPLYDNAPFTTALKREENRLILWAANPEGRLSMTATAELSD